MFDLLAASEFPLARDDLAFLNYNPRFDGDFFEEDHEVALAEAPQLPTLLGFNKHEGIFMSKFFSEISPFNDLCF